MAEIESLVAWFNNLPPLFQILLGVVGVTWFPAGTIAGSLMFATNIRTEPVTTLERWWGNVLGFCCAVTLGWTTLLLYGILFRLTENRQELFSGFLLPRKRAREEAERLRELMKIGGWKEPLTRKQRRAAS
jgi:hypothetical protein